MTCVVGIVEDGKIYMGADSLESNANCEAMVRKDSKVFINEEFIIGFTSSFRMGQILRFKFKPPSIEGERYGLDIFKYMCVDFVDSLRKCFSESGFLRVQNSEESGGTFLVGTHGRLFLIEGDFQVSESINNFNVCGAGENLALGALYALDKIKYETPPEKIRIALEAAERFNGSVRRPFKIEVLEN